LLSFDNKKETAECHHKLAVLNKKKKKNNGAGEVVGVWGSSVAQLEQWNENAERREGVWKWKWCGCGIKASAHDMENLGEVR
jgi:hypothetical protein